MVKWLLLVVVVVVVDSMQMMHGSESDIQIRWTQGLKCRTNGRALSVLLYDQPLA